MEEPLKLAILTTHPIQYFVPVFRLLGQKKDLQLKVFFGCKQGLDTLIDPDFGVVYQWDCELTDGYAHEFIGSGSLATLKKLSSVPLTQKALTLINQFQPDVVLIFAYLPIFITISTLLLRLKGYKLMLRADTTDGAWSRSILKDKLREVLLKLYYKQFSFFFPISIDSVTHYQRMGVNDNLMQMIPYAIDVDFFQQQVDHWFPRRVELRKEMGIKPGDRVLIYCGKMYETKNPLLIPKALNLLSDELKQNLWLLAVGDGTLRNQFETLTKAELGERVIFVGFKNQSQLGKYYAMGDILILPSHWETWGLVVNEALQFGLTVITSDKVGCNPHLIPSKDQGYWFRSGSAIALAEAVTQLCNQDRGDNHTPNFPLPHPSDLAEAIYLQAKQQKSLNELT